MFKITIPRFLSAGLMVMVERFFLNFLIAIVCGLGRFFGGDSSMYASIMLE